MSVEIGSFQHPEILFSEKILKAPFKVYVNPNSCTEILKDAGVKDPAKVRVILYGRGLVYEGAYDSTEKEITLNLNDNTTSLNASVVFSHEAKHAAIDRVPLPKAIVTGIGLGCLIGTQIGEIAPLGYLGELGEFGSRALIALTVLLFTFGSAIGVSEVSPEEIAAKRFANKRRAHFINSENLPIRITPKPV